MSLSGHGWACFYGIFLIGLTFFGFGQAFGSEPESVSEAGPASRSANSEFKQPNFSSEHEIEFSISAGLRSDELDWSIAGTAAGTNPDVLSELDWSDLDSYQVTLANRSRFLRHIYCRTMFSYASINDGTVRDSDYDGDNRTLEWSRSFSETNGDEVYDFSTAGGYAFLLLNDHLLVAPLLGVSYHKQNLRITNGVQVISEDPLAPAIGPLSSQLNSTYFARWMGPWIGCDLRYLTKNRGPQYLTMAFGLSVELHFADYYGEGNWNLRSDLDHPKSFEQEADGYGICISGEWIISMTDHWDLAFTANYQNWSTGSGTDRKFLSGGGSTVTRFNGADWTSSSFMVGAGYHF